MDIIGCLEIGSDALRVVLGYELGGEPVVVFAHESPYPGLVKEDQINLNEVSAALASFHSIADPIRKVTVNLTNVNLVLPSAGFKVFADEKSTAIVNPEAGVEKIDVTNVISLVTQQTLPAGLSRVDVIPDRFILADGSVYGNPPLGKKTTSLEVKAKVYCLPTEIRDVYNKAVSLAGYRVNKQAVSAYCAAKLIASYKDLPDTYILLDMGSRVSTLSFIGEGAPYSSLYFYQGGADLTEKIASSFGLDFANAEKLKVKYGYDPKLISYNPDLATGNKEDGTLTHVKQADLNQVIEDYFHGYAVTLSNCLATLMKDYPGSEYASLPVLLVGGASKLSGLESFLTKILAGREVIKVVPRSIGARDPKYANLLGLLLCCKYSGSLADNQRGVAPLSRTQVKKDKGKRRPSPEDDAL